MVRVERSLVHKPVSPDLKHARSNHRSSPVLVTWKRTYSKTVYSLNYTRLMTDKGKGRNLTMENPHPLEYEEEIVHPWIQKVTTLLCIIWEIITLKPCSLTREISKYLYLSIMNIFRIRILEIYISIRISLYF